MLSTSHVEPPSHAGKISQEPHLLLLGERKEIIVLTKRKPLKQHFFREGRLTEDQAQYILKEGTRFLKEEPNLLRVEGPITGTDFPVQIVKLCGLTLVDNHRLNL